MTERALVVHVLGLNYSPEPTGIAPYTTSLAEGLVARGHSVEVTAAHPHYPEWRVRDGFGGWRTRRVQRGVTVTRLSHYIPAHPGNIRRLLSEISFGLRLFFRPWGHPDVVVLVSPALISSAIASFRTRWSRRRPAVVVWVQDIYSLGIRETGAGGGRSAAVLRVIESWTLRNASSVVVIHDRFKEFLNRTLSVSEAKLHVVRNWAHLPEVGPNCRTEVRRMLGWNDDEVIVLHAGNQGTKQGLENVIAAARAADRQSARVRFVLLGDGSQRQQLGALGRGVDRLQFIAPLPEEEYQSVMAASDVLLVNERPGVKEMAVPSKLTSYFSTGLPVVAATDAGSVTADEIRASGGGIRVDAGDPIALVKTVMNLGNDYEKARALGVNGLKYRREVLSQQAAIERYERVILEAHDQRK